MRDSKDIKTAKKVYRKEGRIKLLDFCRAKWGMKEGLRIAKDVMAGTI